MQAAHSWTVRISVEVLEETVGMGDHQGTLRSE